MPAAALLQHTSAQRRTAGDPAGGYVRQPSQDLIYAPGVVDAPWFPEGGAASPPSMIVSPKSHGPNDFPGLGSPNLLTGPATAEWIEIRDSHEQGIGVDPGRKWPRQHHTESYNFTSLAWMPFPDQLGPVYTANLNRPEKAGWSTPKYSEQYEQPVGQYSLQDAAQTRDPASLAFAIGWGYVG